jgi:hypothetical protein
MGNPLAVRGRVIVAWVWRLACASSGAPVPEGPDGPVSRPVISDSICTDCAIA